MKKLTVVVVLCLLLGAAGCTAEQMQEQVKIQKVTTDTSALVSGIWADPNLSDVEKVKATSAVITGYSKEIGLIEAEDESAFLDYINWLWTAYMTWYPEKSTVVMLGLVIGLAVAFLKKEKKPEEITKQQQKQNNKKVVSITV